MCNALSVMRLLAAMSLATVCLSHALASGSTVVDFTRVNQGKGGGVVPDIPKPQTPCDAKLLWTCKFVKTDPDRSIDNVGTAHINSDGSILLQEDNGATPADGAANLFSALLPGWYVSSGLTNYALLGTDCMFNIQPILSTSGDVTDWTMTITGKKGGPGKPDTCGGPTPPGPVKRPSPKLKKGPSDKGPGPK